MGSAIGKGILQTIPQVQDFKGHWAESYIKEFIKLGYIDGYSDGTIKPDGKVTRAEFTKLVNKVFGFTQTTDISFGDVKSNQWYYKEVSIGVSEGYIDGYPDNTFRPDDYISREEACKIIGSILNKISEGETSFVDNSSISDWAKVYVKGLTESGIIQGFQNKFNPQNNMTRAESIKTLYFSK